MTVLASGNVGIGTTIPGAVLDVQGTATYLLRLLNGASTRFIVSNGGVIYEFGEMSNGSGSNKLDISGTSPTITRTTADANPAFVVNESNASATGDILQLKNSAATVLTVQQGGNVGIGTTSPTAKLNIAAGTATAGTAPIKLTSGVVNTTAETGAIEYNGINLSFVPTGTLRENIFTGAKGNITLTAGTTTTVTNAAAKTTSTIMLTSTSLGFTTLSAYISTKSNGSFVITTLTAAGTETVDYLIIN